MDLFTLDENFKQGYLVNKIENIVWTERYLEASDFKIVSHDVPRLLKAMPLGTYLSHSKTKEVMIVEDIEITKSLSGENTINITGRSVEAFAMSNRISLPNKNGARVSRTTDLPNEYIVSANSSWHQAVQIIVDQLIETTNFWADNAEPKLSCYTNIDGFEVDRTVRTISPGVLYDQVLELLKVSDSGIKTQRPESGFDTLDFVIHQGSDLSGSIVFSAMLGDLNEVSYFWSTRNEKNAAFARAKFSGKWYVVNNTTLYPPLGAPKGLDIKWVYVDASSIDNDETITEVTYDAMVQAKAREALAAKNKIMITQAKVSENSSFVYNKDYFIGDIVGIFGEYDTEQKMRVNEFSWSVDGNKTVGYPSLVPIDSA